MTDKQIIIDGVDVSECNFTLERDGKIKCECTHATGFGVICDCESWKTCDYKNYKRKEQECEELKKNVEHWKIEHKEAKAKGEWTYDLVKKRLGQQLDQLKESNEELQKENDKYSLFIEKLCDYIGLECDSEEQAMRTLLDLTSQMNKAIWIIDRYKQTLAEIKEIANFDCTCGHTQMCICNVCDKIDEIIQKISECEENNDMENN